MVNARYLTSHIKPSQDWAEAVQAAPANNVLVYALWEATSLDVLCLRAVLERHGLPRPDSLACLAAWRSNLLGMKAWNLDELQEAPRCAVLVLPYRGYGRKKKRRLSDIDARLEALVRWQARSGRQVTLAPCMFLWSKSPPPVDEGPVDRVLGSGSEPRPLRRYSQALLNRKHAVMRHAPTILSLPKETPPAQEAERLRRAMLRELTKERIVVHGPTRKSPKRILEELLRSPRVQRHIAVEARVTGRSTDEVADDVRKELRKLAAAQDPAALRWLHRGLQWTWRNIYDGIEVDEAGIERIRKVARQGGVVLMPSHRSHIDYLVLSDVLYSHAMSPPLIAAGDNLNFWPAGALLRRGGAFFIRRSFRGQKLYPALVEAYIRKLLKERYSIEFFIEGGRSRTGKLLGPKLGLLSILVDSALLLKEREVFFVPVSITYDRVLEGGNYVAEQQGAEKRREDIWGLLGAYKTLRGRHGKVYVRVGEPLSLSDIVAEAQPADPSNPGALKPKARRWVVQELARRVIGGIGRSTVVTPVALVASALLSVRRQNGFAKVGFASLKAHMDTLYDALKQEGAPFSQELHQEGHGLSTRAAYRALVLLEEGSLVRLHEAPDQRTQVTLPDRARYELDYYRNNAVHFVSCRAIVGLAGLSLGGSFRREALSLRSDEVLALLKRDLGPCARELNREALDARIEAALSTGSLREQGQAELGFGSAMPHWWRLAAQLAADIEAYWLVAHVIREHTADAVPIDEWIARAMDVGQKCLENGALSRPEALVKPKLLSGVQMLREAGFVRDPSHELLGPREEGGAQTMALLESLRAALQEPPTPTAKPRSARASSVASA